MSKDNYLLENEVLQITTEHLTIRITKNNKGKLHAFCYLNNSDNCNVNKPLFDVIASRHLRYYSGVFKYNFNLFDYYEEARLALLNVIKWKEYWLNTNEICN